MVIRCISYALMVTLVCGLTWLIVNNRASEKIYSVVLPGLLTGVAAIACLLMYGNEAPVHEVFPTTFTYYRTSKLPFRTPETEGGGRYTGALSDPERLAKVAPSVTTDPADPQGQHLYHHLLQKSIIDCMRDAYSASWQVDLVSYELPLERVQISETGPASDAPGQLLQHSDLQALLEGNTFSKTISGGPPLHLPDDTRMEVTVPTPKTSGVIKLESPYCTITITTKESVCGVIAAPSKSTTTPLKSAMGTTDICTAVYRIQVDASFTPWYVGHPEMPKYKTWTKQLLGLLKSHFDEDLIRPRVREELIFRRTVDGPQMHNPSRKSEGDTSQSLQPRKKLAIVGVGCAAAVVVNSLLRRWKS